MFPEKTSRCRVENIQTQPTFDAGSGNRTRATLVGGDCSHHCAIPAARKYVSEESVHFERPSSEFRAEYSVFFSLKMSYDAFHFKMRTKFVFRTSHY